MREEYAFSQRRACGLVMLAVSSYRYRTRRDDEPLRNAAGGAGARQAALRLSAAAGAVARAREKR